MAIRARENVIGAWAFLIGIILAIIVGIIAGKSTNPLMLVALAFLGIVVGYFVAEKDVQTFLFASVSLVISSFAGIQGFAANVGLAGLTVIGIEFAKFITSILVALLFLFIPATIIVALKTMFSLAKS